MVRILIRQADGFWREPAAAGYAVEAELQEILAAHPELIPGVSADAETCREFQLEVGPADIVVVDANGELTLVECKLAANPQIRREVVGQMFDYASRLWKMDVDDFDARWVSRNHASLFQDQDGPGPLLRDEVARNLAEGRFRIVLAVDRINEPLKKMVEYLNSMSGPDTSVVAVEYSRLRQDAIEILVPQIYGQELAEAKSAAKVGSHQSWDRGRFRAWLESNEPAVVGNFDVFTEETELRGLEFTGSSRSAGPAGGLRIVDARSRWLGTVSLFHFSGQGTSIEFNFIRMSKMADSERPESAVLESFLDELGNISELAEVAGNLRSSWFATRRPNVPLSTMTTESVRRAAEAWRFLPIDSARRRGRARCSYGQIKMFTPCSDASAANWLTAADLPWQRLASFGPTSSLPASLRTARRPIRRKRGTPKSRSKPGTVCERDGWQ